MNILYLSLLILAYFLMGSMVSALHRKILEIKDSYDSFMIGLFWPPVLALAIFAITVGALCLVVYKAATKLGATKIAPIVIGVLGYPFTATGRAFDRLVDGKEKEPARLPSATIHRE